MKTPACINEGEIKLEDSDKYELAELYSSSQWDSLEKYLKRLGAQAYDMAISAKTIEDVKIANGIHYAILSIKGVIKNAHHWAKKNNDKNLQSN